MNRRPNILLVHTDQHRFDCLGAAGNPEIKTPNFDTLAADGLLYRNSFCPYPVCTPSRYSLLSGLYVHEHQGWSNHSTPRPGVRFFPELLKEHGWRTKAVGKMHFTPTYLDVGFEEMSLAEQHGPGRWDDDYHRELKRLGLADIGDLEDQVKEFRNGASEEYWKTFGARPSELPEENHSTTWIGERAVKTLEDWDNAGNFLMVGFIKPHHPFDPPKPWDTAYDPENISLPTGWVSEQPAHDRAYNAGYFPNEKLTETALRRITAFYYAAVSHIDQQVGRMIETLKRKEIYDDTLVIFTSDHGEYLGFHHMILKSNYPYDPLFKVPLVIKFPGGRRRGETSEALVSNVDLAPTILGQAGIEPPEQMHGLDLEKNPEGREVVFCESRREVAVRTRTRKLILPEKGAGEPLFFDLEEDPLERNNLFGDPQRAEEIRDFREAALEWGGGAKRLTPVLVDEETRRITAPNVRWAGDGKREEVIAYYRKKVAAHRRKAAR